jgi:hypothetical protein
MTLVRSGSKRHPTYKYVDNDEEILKRAIKNEMIEHVFYTTSAKHVKGTNEYNFEYPGEWRTSNTELDFGIRGIYLKKASRTVDITVTIHVNDSFGLSPGTLSFVQTVNSLYAFTPNVTLYDFVDYLNEYWQETITDDNIRIGFEWRYHPQQDAIIFDKTPISIVQDWKIEAMSNDFQYIGKIEVISSNHLIVINMWDRGECLLKASFTNQTENRHLGYTNMQYHPIKFYHILKPCPVTFKIELFTASGQFPVELPEDGLDYIVLECVVKS